VREFLIEKLAPFQTVTIERWIQIEADEVIGREPRP
jgi:hypothetical protein